MGCSPRFKIWLPVLAVAGLLAQADAFAAADDDLAWDEKLVEQAGVGVDGPALLDFFRKRTPDGDLARHIAGLTQGLGDDDFEVRERAAGELTKVGRPAVPALQRAAKSDDPEVAARARQCLRAIGARDRPDLTAAAARLVAARRPEGAVAVLLGYLPHAEDEFVEEDLIAAVAAAGVRDGKPDPALAAAARGKQPLLRRAAAEALARASGEAARADAHKLLRDEDARVRFQAARALLAAGDEAAVPALVALLADGPADLAWLAEECLQVLAGRRAPGVRLDPSTPAGRRKCRDAWDGWWKADGDKADWDLFRREERRLGLTLACDVDTGGNFSRVWSFGADGKTRWQIDGLRGCTDVQPLPGGRVLICEFQGKKVTERDREGKVLWEHPLSAQPRSAQRLPDGNTLIATDYRVLEVTREGKTVFSHEQRDGIIHCARKQRDGHLFYVHWSNQIVELDAAGKEVRRIPVVGTGSAASLEVLPGHRFLVALYGVSRVAEVDGNGKVVWEVPVSTPTDARRLPNGNTLVASGSGTCLVEFDRAGKEVAKQPTTGLLRCVRRY